MQSAKSVFLLSMVAITLLPWQMVCMAHPMGHNHHHEPGELSPCEKRKRNKDTAFWPLMDCDRMAIDTGHYRRPHNENLIRAIQTLFVAPVKLQLVKIELPQAPALQLPEPRGNSDPPPESISRRGPPFS